MAGFVLFLENLMRERNLRPAQLAKELGVSVPTMMRWLSGDYLPNISSCRKISEYTGESLDSMFLVKRMDTHRREADTLPELREYLSIKYADELDEDIISMFEHVIRKRRKRIHDESL
jgi:transcriptional regulator with XRE-family HTH domain